MKTSYWLSSLAVTSMLVCYSLAFFSLNRDSFITSVPEDFQQTLHKYAVDGLRIIAVATKSLDTKVTWAHSQRIAR
jgi:magnesium-transporting ATPase (P-type)